MGLKDFRIYQCTVGLGDSMRVWLGTLLGRPWVEV